MNKDFNLELLRNKIGKVSIPTISAVSSMDNDLLKLFAFQLVQDKENIPSEISNIYNNITAENIKELTDSFDYDLTLSNINNIVAEMFDLNYLPYKNLVLADIKVNRNKNATFRLIDCYYLNKYVNPFLENRDDTDFLKDFIIKNLNEIKKDKNVPILSFYYLLEGVVCFEKINPNESIKLNEYLIQSVDMIISLLNLSNEKMFELLEEYSTLKKKHMNVKDKVSNFKSDVDLLRKENKKLEKALNLKKNKENIVLIREIKNEIDKSSKNIKEYNIDVIKRSYESIIKKNIDEISDLKGSLKVYDYKYKELEDKYNNLKNSINDEYVISYLKENKDNKYIKEQVFSLYDFNSIKEDISKEKVEIKASLISNESLVEESFEDLLSKYDFRENDMQFQNQTQNKTEDNSSVIGYVSVEDNKHFINFTNGTKKEILNIPFRAFLGDGQFVVTNKSGEYKYSLKQYKNEDIPLNSVLALIREEDGELIAEVDNKIIKIDNHMNFKINDVIVGIIDGFRIKRLFKNLSFNADYYLKSIKAKNLDVYYVVKDNGYNFAIRNIETGEEVISEINEHLKKDDILIVNEYMEIVTKFNNPKFYINSSYYENDLYGIISIKNNTYTFKDIDTNKEKLIDYVPVTVEDGSIIRIDEFNRFIETVDLEDFVPNKQLRKDYKKNKLEKSTNKEDINIIGNVLIIGDIGLQHSYKLASLKKGYRATVLDGYEAYNKVFKEAKKADKIVIAEDFVDHNTMWALKKNYNNILYAKNKGANFIAEQLSNNIVSRKQMELVH